MRPPLSLSGIRKGWPDECRRTSCVPDFDREKDERGGEEKEEEGNEEEVACEDTRINNEICNRSLLVGISRVCVRASMKPTILELFAKGGSNQSNRLY